MALGYLLPASEECGEVSLSTNRSQAETSTSARNIETSCKLLRTYPLNCANLCASLAGAPSFCVQSGRIKKGAPKRARVRRNKDDEPALIIKANLLNLTPGPHAFHIHEKPDCGPKAKAGVMVPGFAAGEHLFAEYKTGGIEPVTLICKSDLGKLPNLLVNADSTATEEVVLPRLTLADIVNRSILIHAGQDDSSPREACGVFK